MPIATTSPRPLPQRWLAALAVVLSALLLPPHAPAAAADPPVARPDITIEALLPSWRQRVEWAVDRFAAAGLPLPPLEVTVHRNTRPCNGNSGLYRPGRPAEVHICSIGAADTRAARLITLHELAHAWAENFLHPHERAEFLELRGLRTWTDAATPPQHWGAEHAAEVVSWGLMDAEVSIIRIEDADPTALRAGYELLVDQPPMWQQAA